jgi:hypothetical protein
VFPDRRFHGQLLLDWTSLQHDSPDVPEIGIDEAVSLFGIPVRHRLGGSGSLACLAGLSTGPPCLRCLSGPQGAVAEG